MTDTHRGAVSGARLRRETRLRFEALEDRTLLSVAPNGPEFLVNTYTSILSPLPRRPWTPTAISSSPG